MASRVFPSCQQQNHEILRDGETCHSCSSPPWRPLPSFSSSSSRTGREETAFTIDGELFTFNHRMPSPLVERPSGPHKRGISEVMLRPEREEEDRLTRPTQRPDLAGENSDPGRWCNGRGGCSGHG